MTSVEIREPDIFRKISIELSEEQINRIYHIKNKADELYSLLNYLKNREIALAKTKLEECVMWAVKGITA